MDDFWKWWRSNTSGTNENWDYVNPYRTRPSFVKNVTELNNLILSLFGNSLSKDRIISEKVTMTDEGLHLDLVVETETKQYRVQVSPHVESDDDEDNDEQPETTDYFTP